jgi:oxalate decarboxylase
VQGDVPPDALPAVRNRDQIPSQLNHKYRLGVAPLITFAGGSERVVTAQQFPISTTITGVVMTLRPGGLRELHWHPNADEWQYYLKGRAQVGIFAAHGNHREDEFGPGQVAYIDRGFGHYIKQVGDEETQILIAFNSPDYQEISLSAWLASNPLALLETNFGVDAGMIAKMPDHRLKIIGAAR